MLTITQQNNNWPATHGGRIAKDYFNLLFQLDIRIRLLQVKNAEDRLVVLNPVARKVIERQRGKHPEFVFVYKGKPITRMLNNGWRKARKQTNLAVRVHDLKHTFGRRLRAAGVSFEDRQDLLGHKSARITTHYSTAELLNLWEASSKVCDSCERPKLTLLRTDASPTSTKSPQRILRVI